MHEISILEHALYKRMHISQAKLACERCWCCVTQVYEPDAAARDIEYVPTGKRARAPEWLGIN